MRRSTERAVLTAALMVGTAAAYPASAGAVSETALQTDYDKLGAAYISMSNVTVNFVVPDLAIVTSTDRVTCYSADGKKKADLLAAIGSPAFFCNGPTDSDDRIIVLEEALERGSSLDRRASARAVLAHELGHAVDDQTRKAKVISSWIVQAELHADCLAGQTAGKLWPKDIDAMADTLYNVGDDIVGGMKVVHEPKSGKVVAVSGYTHGLGAEREDQFMLGVRGDGCGSIDSVPTEFSKSVTKE